MNCFNYSTKCTIFEGLLCIFLVLKNYFCMKYACYKPWKLRILMQNCRDLPFSQGQLPLMLPLNTGDHKVMKNHWKSCFPGISSRSCPTPRALTISSLDSLESSFQELFNASKLDIIASRDGQHAQVLFQTWNHHFLTILHKIFKKNRRKTMIFVHFPFEFTHP